MWTQDNADSVTLLLKSFKPKNRFIIPCFVEHCAANGRSKLATKFKASLVNKVSGHEALRSASERHVCMCCQDRILPRVSIVCPTCLNTPGGKAISKQETSKRLANACLKRYGVTNPMHTDKVKRKQLRNVRRAFSGDNRDLILAKRRKTSLEKYGTTVPAKNIKVRKKVSQSTQRSWDEHKDERMAKTYATSKKKYGVDHYTQDPSVQEKHRTTLLQRHGHENAAWGDKAKVKRIETFYKRFGTDHPLKNKVVKKQRENTCIERYGVRSPMQVSEIRKKAVMASQKLTKVKVEGRVFWCQGYEKYVLPKLVKKFGIDDVIGQFDQRFESLTLGRHVYTPDFYIKSRDTYIDVKSVFTMYGVIGTTDFTAKNAKLQRVANRKGINLKFLVYDHKSDTSKVLKSDWHTNLG